MCEHYPRIDLGPFENAFGKAVILLAGRIGELMVRVPDGWQAPSVHEADIEAVASRALAPLPVDEAALIAWVRTQPSTGSDADKSWRHAEAAGAERAAFL